MSKEKFRLTSRDTTTKFTAPRKKLAKGKWAKKKQTKYSTTSVRDCHWTPLRDEEPVHKSSLFSFLFQYLTNKSFKRLRVRLANSINLLLKFTWLRCSFIRYESVAHFKAMIQFTNKSISIFFFSFSHFMCSAITSLQYSAVQCSAALIYFYLLKESMCKLNQIPSKRLITKQHAR